MGILIKYHEVRLITWHPKRPTSLDTNLSMVLLNFHLCLSSLSLVASSYQSQHPTALPVPPFFASFMPATNICLYSRVPSSLRDNIPSPILNGNNLVEISYTSCQWPDPQLLTKRYEKKVKTTILKFGYNHKVARKTKDGEIMALNYD